MLSLTSFDTGPFRRQRKTMTEAGVSRRESKLGGGGSIPGAEGQAAYTVTMRDGVPIVLAVPHAGRCYPGDLVAQMRHSDAARMRLEDRFVDLLAECVARDTGAPTIVAQAPRAMIDLNRAPDDIDWSMIAGPAPEGSSRLAAGRRARSGLGLIPRRLPGLGELWRRPLSGEELDGRIEHIHRPYHAMLARTLERVRDRWGAVLLIDLHSMPPLGLKRGAEAAPDFVIGDRFGSSCGAPLSAAALEHFAAAGLRAAHNRPYAGGYALDRHCAPARGLHAMQIEVCRSTYLDAQLAEPAPGMIAVASVLTALVRRLAEELTGAGGHLAQAAE